LRAEFPNPDGWLLPGMFVIGKLEEAVSPDTILVSQRAVVIGPDGSATVMLVTPVSTNWVVQPQPVQLGAATATNWVVQSGLKAGDRVIVDGLLKAYPGMNVNPVDIGSTNAPAANQ
jgi:multidrug efflux pump subunit AcrA (membrane-fusion protein)